MKARPERRHASTDPRKQSDDGLGADAPPPAIVDNASVGRTSHSGQCPLSAGPKNHSLPSSLVGSKSEQGTKP